MVDNLTVPLKLNLTTQDELHLSDPIHSGDSWNIVHLSAKVCWSHEYDSHIANNN